MIYKVIKGIKESEGEKRVKRVLIEMCIHFAQEVELEGCINSKTGYNLRFDFYIPSVKTVIEYDGKDFHNSDDQIYRDSIKNNFCKENGIRIIRLQGFDNIIKLKSYNLGDKSRRLPQKGKNKQFRRDLSPQPKKECKIISKADFLKRKSSIDPVDKIKTLGEVMRELGIKSKESKPKKLKVNFPTNLSHKIHK